MNIQNISYYLGTFQSNENKHKNDITKLYRVNAPEKEEKSKSDIQLRKVTEYRDGSKKTTYFAPDGKTVNSTVITTFNKDGKVKEVKHI